MKKKLSIQNGFLRKELLVIALLNIIGDETNLLFVHYSDINRIGCEEIYYSIKSYVFTLRNIIIT